MPMMRPVLESMLEKVGGNKYVLAVVAAKRARQLKEGQLPMVDVGSTNPVTVALEEVAAGKVRPGVAGGPAKPVPAAPADVRGGAELEPVTRED